MHIGWAIAIPSSSALFRARDGLLKTNFIVAIDVLVELQGAEIPAPSDTLHPFSLSTFPVADALALAWVPPRGTRGFAAVCAVV